MSDSVIAVCALVCVSVCLCRNVSGEASVLPVDIRFSHKHHRRHHRQLEDSWYDDVIMASYSWRNHNKQMNAIIIPRMMTPCDCGAF